MLRKTNFRFMTNITKGQRVKSSDGRTGIVVSTYERSKGLNGNVAVKFDGDSKDFQIVKVESVRELPLPPQYEQYFDLEDVLGEEHEKDCDCEKCEFRAMNAYVDLVDAKIKDDEYPHMTR